MRGEHTKHIFHIPYELHIKMAQSRTCSCFFSFPKQIAAKCAVTFSGVVSAADSQPIASNPAHRPPPPPASTLNTLAGVTLICPVTSAPVSGSGPGDRPSWEPLEAECRDDFLMAFDYKRVINTAILDLMQTKLIRLNQHQTSNRGGGGLDEG